MIMMMGRRNMRRRKRNMRRRRRKMRRRRKGGRKWKRMMITSPMLMLRITLF